MHEMSIALSIIDIAEEEALRANASGIKDIEIEIGAISGVDISALKFALDIAVKNTMLETTIRNFTLIQAKGECPDCNSIFPLEGYYQPCPKCNSPAINIIQGKELRIKSMNIY